MSSFPRVPYIHGDTDDDASIHLHNHVGSSRPLERPVSRVDDEIKRLVDDDSGPQLTTVNMDRYYNLYKQGRLTDLDSDQDSDDSEPLSDSETIGKGSRTKKLSKPTTPQSDKSKILYLVAFFFGVSFMLTSKFLFSRITEPDSKQVWDQNRIMHNVNLADLQNDMRKLKDVSNSIVQRQETLETNHQSLRIAIDAKINIITEKFEAIDAHLVAGSNQYKELRSQFESLKHGSGIDVNAFSELEGKIDEVTKIYQEFKHLRANLVGELIDTLPAHVPVYIKEKKIHILPEFQKYLYSFADNYMKGKGNTTHIDHPIEREDLLSKSQFESLLEKKLVVNNKFILDKFNNLVDSLSIQVNGSSDAPTITNYTNKILLHGLLETFAKGSIKVNYANYSLGARILGFLTKRSLSHGDVSSRSFAGKVFFGWYDYLTSSRVREGTLIQSPQNWKYNANNVLLDNGAPWECESSNCSVGIRFFNSIILTDLVIISDTPTEAIVSLYIKPTSVSLVQKLVDYLDSLKFSSKVKNADNKYLKKFIKIRDFAVSDSVTHLKLPVSLINLKIPTRDIYVEFNSNKSPITVNNIKAYGITELGAYEHSHQLELMLDKLTDDVESADFDQDTAWEKTQEATDSHQNYFDSVYLGDDIIY